MDEDHLASVIDALQAGRHGEYEELVAAFSKAQSADAFWLVLGKAHGTAFNVFEQLSAWPADDIRRAMRRLMPAVAHVQSISEAEGIQTTSAGASNTRW